MLECFWYILASVLAGVGTGLVGLSAATVMVPILIVLCPSFAGETGAYQATAIALASDILGSAVTTATYIRHKNIDLRRGWIMLSCIIGMCTVGSFAAWSAGNVVLGGFTLILTFCIGIRFLVKPGTERSATAAKGAALGWKGVAVSLFFGLTIGFGTGFVGSGGGMMMLVVFTAFLGMERKVAVGTSTFIMTFTALIASVSHILIHPTILLERWPVLILCMTAATTASLASARFANRVDSRTVGLVTGVVLTLLGAALILLHYWEQIKAAPLLYGVFACTLEFLEYIVPAAVILLCLHRFFKIPSYVFRKLLHLAAFTCLVEMMWAAEKWYQASLTALLFAAAVYPILCALEGQPWFDGLFVQKGPGEVKKSLLLLFVMDAALVTVCWGGFGLPWAAAASILMWGTGDGAAALVGHRFGKHYVKLPLADPKKTWEGSAAMAGVSALVGTAFMLVMADMPWYQCLLSALATAIPGAYTELISRGGNDTVTVPVVNTAVLLALHFAFSW